MTSARVRVLEVIQASGRVFMKLQLLSGTLIDSKVFYSQTSGASFRVLGVGFLEPEIWASGIRAGRSLSEVAEEARQLGRLPTGLKLNVIEVNGQWVALNNRTLAVARMANLADVSVHDVGPSGMNMLTQLLRNSDLVSPVEVATMRCK